MRSKLIQLEVTRHTRIDIITDKNKIILWQKGQPVITKLINARQYTFGLTVISLQTGAKRITIPIFINSIPSLEYKALRMFLAWH